MHALKSPFQEQFPVLDFSYTPLIIIASQTSRTSGWDLSVLRSFACTCVRALVFGLGLGLAGQPVLSSPAAAEELVAFTGYLPPLSINEQEKGIAVELMELVAEEAGLDIKIRFAPWRRAQLLAENTPGSLLFTAAYSRNRSEKFQYIAPLLYTESAFVTLDQPLDTFEKAIESGKVIGVHLGSQRSQILQRFGYLEARMSEGGGDGFRESVRIGQRCHLVRTHEGRDLDGIRPGTGQKLHQPQFGLRWQDLSLGLKPIPRGHLVDMQLRQDLNTGKPAETS